MNRIVSFSVSLLFINLSSGGNTDMTSNTCHATLLWVEVYTRSREDVSAHHEEPILQYRFVHPHYLSSDTLIRAYRLG